MRRGQDWLERVRINWKQKKKGGFHIIIIAVAALLLQVARAGTIGRLLVFCTLNLCVCIECLYTGLSTKNNTNEYQKK